MSDVRLTATNPADSSVVPVACNDKGELLVDVNNNVDYLTVTNSVVGRIDFTDNSGNIFSRFEGAKDGASGSGDYPGKLVFSTTADGASSPTERMRIGSTGVVSVGGTNTAPGSGNNSVGHAFIAEGTAYHSRTSSQALVLNRTSTTGVIADLNYNGSEVGNISVTASSTAYNTSSDYRLKENVNAVTDGITRLQQLKPSRFNFIADPAKTVDGFIAHEVQTIVPEAITGEKDAVDDEGNPLYQGIDQSKLVPLLTAALQEAIGEIESLKARLDAANF